MKSFKTSLIESLLGDEDVLMANTDKEFKTQIKQFLKKTYTNVSKFKISKEPDTDGKYVVDCSGGTGVKDASATSLTNGMFKFNKIEKYFICNKCTNLTSLEGAPKEVGGDFECSMCSNITSLEGAPEYVGGDFICNVCSGIKSLEGAPKEVGGNFYCCYCTSLTSLESAPKEVGKGFYCMGCKSLTSLKGTPKETIDSFDCSYCTSLTSLNSAPKEVGNNFYCTKCGKEFTEDDVRAVSNVKYKIYC